MAVPCCLGVLIYTAFVGFEIPALRTLLSAFIFIGFLLLKQPIKPFTLLVYSASLLLLMDRLVCFLQVFGCLMGHVLFY